MQQATKELKVETAHVGECRAGMWQLEFCPWVLYYCGVGRVAVADEPKLPALVCM